MHEMAAPAAAAPAAPAVAPGTRYEVQYHDQGLFWRTTTREQAPCGYDTLEEAIEARDALIDEWQEVLELRELRPRRYPRHASYERLADPENYRVVRLTYVEEVVT